MSPLIAALGALTITSCLYCLSINQSINLINCCDMIIGMIGRNERRHRLQLYRQQIVSLNRQQQIQLVTLNQQRRSLAVMRRAP
jgi:hypothetical protein